MDRPMRERYYRPQEKPRMYPLELTPDSHICLWGENGEYKWTIAYWRFDDEGAYLHFVGDRPLDKRVDWRNFEAVVRQGQLLADAKWRDDKDGMGLREG